MKKIVLALVVLMFAAPAWADVNITCTDLGEGKVLVSFDARTEDPNLVRGFGLNIQCDNDANIVDVNDDPLGLGPDNQEYWYWVFPGTIQITGNQVTYKGTAVGEVDDSPDTLPGPPDSGGVTIEMSTLYAPVGPGSPNAPDPCGPLVILTVDKNTCITISGNVARAGGTGVVMENPDDDPTVNFPLVTECCVVTVCVGDVDNNGAVNKADIIALVNYLAANASAPFWTVPCPPCMEAADVDSNGAVNKADIIALVNYLAANASAPFWTVPCP